MGDLQQILSPVIVWAVLAALFIIGELLTAGFFLFWFGLAAAVSCFLAMLGVGGGWQIAVFVVISAVLGAMSRRFADRVTKEPPVKVASDRALGKKGLVIERIDTLRDTGEVLVEKEKWRADSKGDANIEKDAVIKVVGIEGTRLIVEPAEGEEK